MTSRGSVSSVKKTASTAEAPIWKAYLTVRSVNAEDLNAGNTVEDYPAKGSNGNIRGRKRAKPSTNRCGAGAAIWMMLATPLTPRRSEEDGAAVLKSIRHYWEQLSVNERQQVLFMDEPELVKQLYKLNLSLLCVGLMQRHLKTSNRTTTDATTKTKATVTAETPVASSVVPIVAATTPVEQEGTTVATSTPSTRATTDTSSEKTYELLEAMEFMDIGTGILTVKTELTEDIDRLFTLVGDVLVGFLTSIHVLTESNFNKLFVAESETINTWVNYQRLIAMLVEQLILRSYVSHLEKEAAQQMEQLLLEVSLEDKATSTATSTSAPHIKKKSKKKKKKSTARAVSGVQQSDTFGLTNDVKRDGIESIEQFAEEEPIPEPMPGLVSISDCQRRSSTESVDTVALDVDEVMPSEVENVSKKSGLNPHALVFQPQEHVPAVHRVDERSPLAGKRKFDEYIVSVPWGDVASDDGSTFDSRSVEGDISDEEDEVDDKGDNRRWRKQRRREQDAELERQLQQVYASTSSLFGWDFSRQCELPDPGANLPWSESTLWRTAPKEVVRYFSPGNGDSYSRFHPSSSRYYFNPSSSMPFGPPLLPPPGLEAMAPHHLHGSFGFPAPEFPMVVSSPDFSNAQFHPINHEDQVDI